MARDKYVINIINIDVFLDVFLVFTRTFQSKTEGEFKEKPDKKSSIFGM